MTPIKQKKNVGRPLGRKISTATAVEEPSLILTSNNPNILKKVSSNVENTYEMILHNQDTVNVLPEATVEHNPEASLKEIFNLHIENDLLMDSTQMIKNRNSNDANEFWNSVSESGTLDNQVKPIVSKLMELDNEKDNDMIYFCRSLLMTKQSRKDLLSNGKKLLLEEMDRLIDDNILESDPIKATVSFCVEECFFKQNVSNVVLYKVLATDTEWLSVSSAKFNVLYVESLTSDNPTPKCILKGMIYHQIYEECCKTNTGENYVPACKYSIVKKLCPNNHNKLDMVRFNLSISRNYNFGDRTIFDTCNVLKDEMKNESISNITELQPNKLKVLINGIKDVLASVTKAYSPFNYMRFRLEPTNEATATISGLTSHMVLRHAVWTVNLCSELEDFLEIEQLVQIIDYVFEYNLPTRMELQETVSKRLPDYVDEHNVVDNHDNRTLSYVKKEYEINLLEFAAPKVIDILMLPMDKTIIDNVTKEFIYCASRFFTRDCKRKIERSYTDMISELAKDMENLPVIKKWSCIKNNFIYMKDVNVVDHDVENSIVDLSNKIMKELRSEEFITHMKTWFDYKLKIDVFKDMEQLYENICKYKHKTVFCKSERLQASENSVGILRFKSTHTFISIPCDGDCVFRGIMLSLEREKIATTIHDLRNDIVNYFSKLADNLPQSMLEDFVSCIETENLIEEMQALRESRMFASDAMDMAMLLFPQMLDRRIRIVHNNEVDRADTILQPHDARIADMRPDIILVKRNEIHYDVLVRNEDIKKSTLLKTKNEEIVNNSMVRKSIMNEDEIEKEILRRTKETKDKYEDVSQTYKLLLRKPETPDESATKRLAMVKEAYARLIWLNDMCKENDRQLNVVKENKLKRKFEAEKSSSLNLIKNQKKLKLFEPLVQHHSRKSSDHLHGYDSSPSDHENVLMNSLSDEEESEVETVIDDCKSSDMSADSWYEWMRLDPYSRKHLTTIKKLGILPEKSVPGNFKLDKYVPSDPTRKEKSQMSTGIVDLRLVWNRFESDVNMMSPNTEQDVMKCLTKFMKNYGRGNDAYRAWVKELLERRPAQHPNYLDFQIWHFLSAGKNIDWQQNDLAELEVFKQYSDETFQTFRMRLARLMNKVGIIDDCQKRNQLIKSMDHTLLKIAKEHIIKNNCVHINSISYDDLVSVVKLVTDLRDVERDVGESSRLQVLNRSNRTSTSSAIRQPTSLTTRYNRDDRSTSSTTRYGQREERPNNSQSSSSSNRYYERQERESIRPTSERNDSNNNRNISNNNRSQQQYRRNSQQLPVINDQQKSYVNEQRRDNFVRSATNPEEANCFYCKETGHFRADCVMRKRHELEVSNNASKKNPS